MAIQTYVDNGELVGYLPTVGASVRVPLTDVFESAGIDIDPSDLEHLSSVSGYTIGEAVDSLNSGVGAGKVAKKIGKGLKKAGKTVAKVAKSKVIKGLTSIVKAAVPAPFSAAIGAASGAAKFATSLKKGSKKHARVKLAVQQAAIGKISPKELEAVARKNGVDPGEATDAATIKRVALEAPTNPQAAATLKLATDLTSTEPAQQALAAAAAVQAENPGGQAFVVQAPGGAVYRTFVQAG